MNRPMAVVLTLVVPAALAGFAYLRYRDAADVIGAAIVGLIMIGVTAASVLIVESQRRSGEAAWQEAQRRLRMYGRFVAVFAAAFLVLSVIILVILCRAGGGLSPVECAADSSAPVFGNDARARFGR